MTHFARNLWTALPVLAALAIPIPALAHPGHAMPGVSAFVQGLLHPISGADHITALVLTGGWAMWQGGRSRWALPLAFLVAMLAGFAAAPWLGAGLAETLITASVVGLAAAVVLRLRAPLAMAMPTLAVFGLGHGLAHGLELPGGAQELHFVAGFMLTSIGLIGVGSAVTYALLRGRTARFPG